MKNSKSLLAVGAFVLAITIGPLRSGEQKGRDKQCDTVKTTQQAEESCTKEEKSASLEACRTGTVQNKDRS
jgi:hypothetical protein